MESEDPPNRTRNPNPRRPCSCSCPCCSAPSVAWRRSIKRKLEQLEIQEQELDKRKSISDSEDEDEAIGIARVEIRNEAAALREALRRQQLSIQSLHSELEQERNASASATSEAMSMILRLQREKAETQMEFRQLKRFTDHKMSHDQEEIASLEDLLFKKDQSVQSLSCEVQAYKHRILSYGFTDSPSPSPEPQTPDTATSAANSAANAAAAFGYPPLRCNVRPSSADNEDEEEEEEGEEEYCFGETPKDRIQNIEQRIAHMERMPSSSHDKGVVGFGFSPRRPWHPRRLSLDSYGNSPTAFLIPVPGDRPSETDDVTDRVYTVDAVHAAPDDYVSTPREFLGVRKDNKNNNNNNNNNSNGIGAGDEGEIKRLYMRMQALEADRESMRHTIMAMGTDKAQIVLLKEIAQQLCKEVSPTQKKVVKKPSLTGRFSVVSAIKWVASFVLWRNKSSRVRYTFGLSNSNVGLLLLLEKSTWVRQKRCITRTIR